MSMVPWYYLSPCRIQFQRSLWLKFFCVIMPALQQYSRIQSHEIGIGNPSLHSVSFWAPWLFPSFVKTSWLYLEFSKNILTCLWPTNPYNLIWLCLKPGNAGVPHLYPLRRKCFTFPNFRSRRFDIYCLGIRIRHSTVAPIRRSRAKGKKVNNE